MPGASCLGYTDSLAVTVTVALSVRVTLLVALCVTVAVALDELEQSVHEQLRGAHFDAERVAAAGPGQRRTHKHDLAVALGIPVRNGHGQRYGYRHAHRYGYRHAHRRRNTR